jgi:hypothetical protein
MKTLRWRVGDGTIRLTVEEARWLLDQSDMTVGLIWPILDEG